MANLDFDDDEYDVEIDTERAEHELVSPARHYSFQLGTPQGILRPSSRGSASRSRSASPSNLDWRTNEDDSSAGFSETSMVSSTVDRPDDDDLSEFYSLYSLERPYDNLKQLCEVSVATSVGPSVASRSIPPSVLKVGSSANEGLKQAPKEAEKEVPLEEAPREQAPKQANTVILKDEISRTESDDDSEESIRKQEPGENAAWCSRRTVMIAVVMLLALGLLIGLGILMARQSSQEFEPKANESLPPPEQPEESLPPPEQPEESLPPPEQPEETATAEKPNDFAFPVGLELSTPSATPPYRTTPTPSAPPLTIAPTAPPSRVNTRYPNADSSTVDTWSYLLTVLGEHTKREILLDASRPQGRAFLQILMDHSGDALGSLSRTTVLQNYAVLTLYFATSPRTWDDVYTFTRDKSDVCAWNGLVTCVESANGENVVGTVSVINLRLTGIIPAEICLLEHLERLDLRSNKLSGFIPDCLVDSTSLKALFLSDNLLNGYLPNGLLLVPTLEELVVSNNQLIGDLEALIEGTFIKNVYRYGETWRLMRLNVANNRLSGDVPGFLGALGNLRSLKLHGNDIHGEIDETLCARTHSGLTELTADCEEVACPCCTYCYGT